MHTYNTAQKESKSTGLPLYKVPEPWVEKGGGGWRRVEVGGDPGEAA